MGRRPPHFSTGVYSAVSAYRRGDAELTLFVACRDLSASALLQVDVEGFPFNSIEAERVGAADELSHNSPQISPLDVQRFGNSFYFRANALFDWEILCITLRK